MYKIKDRSGYAVTDVEVLLMQKVDDFISATDEVINFLH